MPEKEGIKKSGPELRGAEIFQDKGGWFYNIVHPYLGNTVSYGPVNTEEIAKSNAEFALSVFDTQMEKDYESEDVSL